MKMFGVKRSGHSGLSLRGGWRAVPLLALFLLPPAHSARAQAANQESLAQRIQQLTDAMARTQAQVDQSQRELDEMRTQLGELRREMAEGGATTAVPTPPAPPPDSSSSSSQAAPESTAAAVQDLRERQAVEESEIATHDQSKVESESKYPIKLTGMLLLNGFVNTGAVDTAATPAVALPGSGSAGASVRQTILGFDARGPHLFGARSFADLRVDFYGSPAANTSGESYSGYYNTNTALLRLRTAHAGLDWDQIRVYFALDRPIINPEEPTSLTAVAEPPLAWSGNLWTWNPQAGITANLAPAGSRGVELQAALIDAGDAPLTPLVPPSGTSTLTPPSSAEQSSRPGVEARIAVLGSDREEGRNHLGAGGYFAPHQSSLGRSYDSWAATLDTRLLLFAHLEFSGSAYRGLALGGLGGGGYKDFAYSVNPVTGGYYFRALEDAGGWAQLKEKASERLQFNAAYGTDNVFAYDLRRYFIPGGSMIQNLARNRTFTGNAIYSPSAYLLFSLEYRRLESFPIGGLPARSNIIGVGAGYKF
jgi:uncharacterized coiled-coil protein SlyX